MSAALAQRLEHSVHIDLDSINTERGLGIDAAPIATMEWAETYQLAYARAEAALSNGQDVIFDATNYSRAQRDILRMNARRQGAQSVVIFVDVPVEECRRRWLVNRDSGDRYDVRDEDFARVVDRFDPPSPDERVVIFMSGMTVDNLATGLRQV